MKRSLVYKIARAGMFGMTVLAGQVQAQTSAVDREAAATNDSASIRGEARERQRISADFDAFAGSESNARALVTGLRTGKPITLTSDGGAGATAAAAGMATFTPPTRPMGYGNIYIALSLAKQRLAAQGITSPTPSQLQFALMGGTRTSGNPPLTQMVPGVLQLRSQGMGWGQIAQRYHVKLGPVIGGMKSAGLSETAASSGAATASAPAGTGIRSAAGVSVSSGIDAKSDAPGRSIVNAGGADGHGGVYPGKHGGSVLSAGGGLASGSAHAMGRGQVK